MKIDHEMVRNWWLAIKEEQRLQGVRIYDLRATKVFQWNRVFVQEIPNEACFNYLACRGYTCNNHGELLLSDEDFDEYKALFDNFMSEEI